MSLFDPSDAEIQPARQAPLEIASDTFLLRGVYRAETMSTNLNSMLIRGGEPVLIDTGMAIHREHWWEDVCSLVEPESIRWIFITHDDLDHTGNLLAALQRCPNAGLVVNRASSWRTSVTFGIPPERIRTVTNGEAFQLGDRKLLPLRPPVFDSPYTLGLYDASTRVYYASDAFCAPMPVEPIDRVDEMPEQQWAGGMALYHRSSLCPWISLVDQQKFAAEVEHLAELDIAVIAAAHTPLIPQSSVLRALELMARLPGSVQAELELAGVGAPISG